MSIAARCRRCIRTAVSTLWAAVTAAGEELFLTAAGADDLCITAADIAAAAAGVENG
jgi:hypothetical protein